VSGDYTRANFGGIETGQSDFMLAFKGLQDTLDDLEKDLESKLAQWEGDARGEYQRAKAQWNQAAQDMAMVLNSLGGVIGEAHQNYSGAERAGQSIWSG
jgi:6 kDa early secretory antigenic target